MQKIKLKNLTYNIDSDEVVFTTSVEIADLKVVGSFNMPRTMLATLYQRARKLKKRRNENEKPIK